MRKILFFLLVLSFFPLSAFSQAVIPRGPIGPMYPGINYPNRYQLNPYPIAPDANTAVVGQPTPYYPYYGYPGGLGYDPYYYGGIQSDGNSVYVPGN